MCRTTWESRSKDSGVSGRAWIIRPDAPYPGRGKSGEMGI